MKIKKFYISMLIILSIVLGGCDIKIESPNPGLRYTGVLKHLRINDSNLTLCDLLNHSYINYYEIVYDSYDYFELYINFYKEKKDSLIIFKFRITNDSLFLVELPVNNEFGIKNLEDFYEIIKRKP